MAAGRKTYKDEITYWAPSLANELGRVTFIAPVSLFAKWEDINVLFIDIFGDEVTSSARIFLWNTDVEPHGYLLRGVSVVADPLTVAGTREIRAFKKIESFNRKLIERVAMLAGR